MYPIKADVVFVIDRVYQNPKAVARLESMLNVIKPKEVRKITDQQLVEMAKQRNWGKGYKERTGAYHRTGAPTLIFNVFHWKKSAWWKQLLLAKRSRGLILGEKPFTHRDAVNHLERNICQNAWEMHSIFGCLHACDYCHVEDFVNIMLDIEELMTECQKMIVKNPELQLYKYDNLSDILTFEPEYNASRPFVEFFATTPDKYLLLYTKSDNVGFLLNLDHRGHTIINWSLSGDTQSRMIEKRTPPLSRRIEAMEKCQKHGYTVRARFSPIVPIPNWQEETSNMIAELFAKVRPDVVTVDIIGFMTPQVMKQVIAPSLMEAPALKILDEQEVNQKFFGKHTFPHAYRREIYQHVFTEVRKHNATIPIALCNETREMWNDFQSQLGKMTPSKYVCCCGPQSVPGNPLLNPPLRDYNP